MAATFALYPSDVKIITFFKWKMFHIAWGKPAVKFLKVAILAKDQSRGWRREMGIWCSVKHRHSETQMSRWTTYLKCWLGLQGFFKSIFINFIYIHIYLPICFYFFFSYLQNVVVSFAFWNVGSISLHTRWIEETVHSKKMETVIEIFCGIAKVFLVPQSQIHKLSACLKGLYIHCKD